MWYNIGSAGFLDIKISACKHQYRHVCINKILHVATYACTYVVRMCTVSTYACVHMLYVSK